MAKKGKKIVKPAGSALDLLVRQFAQPLACLRELVQNSIDAGTNQVEVTLKTEEDHVVLTVIDTGEGMNEHIINTQLTRLFSSDKENDLTKVGKFGIGFVSVFALEPECVVVDTGRDGQSWRVLFDEKRAFQLRKLPQQVEGTRVQLYLPRKRFGLDQLVKEVRSTLSFWCRHCAIDITVNGETIQAAFELDEPLTIAYQETGTRLVAGISQDDEPFHGYYNQGLTLLEGKGSPIPHLSFKIDSRYFEHTLTRDNLIRNDDYDKAMSLLSRVVAREYPARLFDNLRSQPTTPLWDQLPKLASLGVAARDIDAAPLFVDHDGQRYSFSALKGQEVYWQAESDDLSAAVHQPPKRLVLKLEGQKPRECGLQWLQDRGLKVEALDKLWGHSLVVTAVEMQPLVELMQGLGSRLSLRQLTPVRWLRPPEGRPFLWQGPHGATRWDRKTQKNDPILLDVEHPGYAPLLQLGRWSLPLAGQVLMQHLLLLRPESEREELSLWLTERVLELMQ